MDLRTDFDSLQDGDEITLYPNHTNLLHKKPVKAVFLGGYYYCQGTPPADGPDYYWRDVAEYNEGFTSLRLSIADHNNEAAPMTHITITGYTAARNRLEELEAEYLASHPGDTAAGYYMDLVAGHDFSGEWRFVFSPTKYSDLLNSKARALLLKQAGQSHDNQMSGPYRGSRSDEVVGI